MTSIFDGGGILQGQRRNQVDILSAWLRDARCTVAFTGAGISTESGIPDFRSPGGIWTKMAPIEFSDFVRDEEMRKEAWRRKFAMDATFAAAKPGPGHTALADLMTNDRLHHVITQNIDNLHQDSGIADDAITELHGNTTYAHCLSCRKRYELDWIQSRLTPDFTPPDCSECGGLIKTATISFGQAMPEAEMASADEVARDADLFLVIGSSLVVYPAAGFPTIAKQTGARLVIINREETPQDEIADLVIHDEIGPVMQLAVAGV